LRPSEAGAICNLKDARGNRLMRFRWLWNGPPAQLSSGCRSSLCSPRPKWRKRDHSWISLGQSAAQSPTRKRSRDRTGAVISIMRLRRAMLRIVRLRAAQSLRLRVSAMSGGRRQPRARTSKKLSCRMELPSPVNQA